MTTIAEARRPGATVQRIFAIVVRHWHTTHRSPHRLLDVVFWPVFDVLLYGSIATFMRQGNPSASTRTLLAVVAGIIMWQILYQAHVAVSTSFFDEIYARQLPSLLTTPLRPVEWLLGAAIQGLLKVGLGVVAVAAAAGILYGFDIVGAGFAIVPVMALLLLTGWSMSLIVMGVIMFLGQGTESLAWGLLFGLLPLSGAFYPTTVLPGALQPVSAALPTTYTFRAARAVITGDPSPWDQIGVAALGTAALMVIAFTFAAYSLRVFQRRGSISRY